MLVMFEMTGVERKTQWVVVTVAGWRADSGDSRLLGTDDGARGWYPPCGQNPGHWLDAASPGIPCGVILDLTQPPPFVLFCPLL